MKYPWLFPLAVLVMLVLNLSGVVISKFIALAEGVTLWNLLYLLIPLAAVYAARVLYWLIVARWYQLSYLYPFLGLNYGGAMLLGILLFQEEFQWKRLIAVSVIALGLVILNLSENKEEAPGESRP